MNRIPYFNIFGDRKAYRPSLRQGITVPAQVLSELWNTSGVIDLSVILRACAPDDNAKAEQTLHRLEKAGAIRKTGEHLYTRTTDNPIWPYLRMAQPDQQPT